MGLSPAFYLTSKGSRDHKVQEAGFLALPFLAAHKLTCWPGFLPAPLGAVGRGSLLEAALSGQLGLCSLPSGKFSPCCLALILAQLAGVLSHDFARHSFCSFALKFFLAGPLPPAFIC